MGFRGIFFPGRTKRHFFTFHRTNKNSFYSVESILEVTCQGTLDVNCLIQ